MLKNATTHNEIQMYPHVKFEHYWGWLDSRMWRYTDVTFVDF